MAPSLPTARYATDKEAAMERQGEEVHLNETEATGAVKAQGVRYVLGISLLLVVIAMSAVWIIGSVLG
ncbi:MAG TPA: hypothetical protein VJV87_04230 [Sphingomicrobium sp.]|nr:hypothetical protein [Sphingomicrobium sp.]